MSYKGIPGPNIVRREPYYEAETKERGLEVTYQGTQDAILGFTGDLEAQGYNYRIDSSRAPIWELSTRIPQFDPDTENIDRFEITTVSREISIFEHPTVSAAADEYDGLRADGEDTFREEAENAASKKKDNFFSVDPAVQDAFNHVVSHLKSGVTGYQIDTVVLRISRRVSNIFAQGASGQINLDESLLLYTSAELNLPAAVAFTLPSTPSPTFSDSQWTWRKRAQRSEIVGAFTEQVVELEFAPWSTYLYTLAGTNLDW